MPSSVCEMYVNCKGKTNLGIGFPSSHATTFVLAKYLLAFPIRFHLDRLERFLA